MSHVFEQRNEPRFDREWRRQVFDERHKFGADRHGEGSRERPASSLSSGILRDLLGAWNKFPCRFHSSQHFHFVVGIQSQANVEMSFDIVCEHVGQDGKRSASSVRGIVREKHRNEPERQRSSDAVVAVHDRIDQLDRVV